MTMTMTMTALSARATQHAAVLPVASVAVRTCSSKSIYRESVENKRLLAWELDGLMRSGANHDLRVFGVGALAALKSKHAFLGFALDHLHFYERLEQCLEEKKRQHAWAQALVGRNQHETWLWRSAPLAADVRRLEEQMQLASTPPPSDAARRYADAIERDAQHSDGFALVGHFYTRFLADLFGGTMLGAPTRLALRWPSVPSYYQLDFPKPRRICIEDAYGAINDAFQAVDEDDDMKRVALSGASEAFRHNANVYASVRSTSEELQAPASPPEAAAGGPFPRAPLVGAVQGVLNVAVGYVGDRLR
ncbi:hypothetical protein PPROV_001103800 [Pycnococcus provasolii]|uniref:Heme oxygenase n=2 Tax=Pycnococcus provasolii TaxID=41880 RepID=A0A830I2P8_9CHLO|nr:hypothetical protein PPROV_001103800 [Pycnococcus provasolii]